MPARQESCCFTGHRPAKLPWGFDETDARCLHLKARIADALEAAYESGYRHFICGMALGCDLYFCEAALALRERGIRDRPNVGISPLSSEPQGGKDNGLRLRVKAFRGIITSLYDSSFRKLRLAYGTFISRLELRPLTSTPP